MLARLKSLFTETQPIADDRQLAAAALLVEAAAADGKFDAVERDAILGLLVRQFDLSAEEAGLLIERAFDQQQGAVDLHRFTHAVKNAYDAEGRIAIIEMLWEVVLADGALDAYEDTLLRRVGGLLHVPDIDRGRAKQRAKAKLGLD